MSFHLIAEQSASNITVAAMSAVVAVIAGLFGLITIWFQARVQRQNSEDHQANAKGISELKEEVIAVKDLVVDSKLMMSTVREDLSDARSAIKQQDERLEKLEATSLNTALTSAHTAEVVDSLTDQENQP